MSDKMQSQDGTSVEFGGEQLKANAAQYHKNKQIVNAASKYDNVDDAVAALQATWAVLESQSETGAGYTPDSALGFGSSNAAEIADRLMGRGPTVGETRKAFSDLGK